MQNTRPRAKLDESLEELPLFPLAHLVVLPFPGSADSGSSVDVAILDFGMATGIGSKALSKLGGVPISGRGGLRFFREGRVRANASSRRQ